MDIMGWIQSLLSPGGTPPSGSSVTPGSAPTLGGAPATPGTGILGGPPTGESLLGSALRGLAGSFAAGGGGGGTLGQIGRGLSGGVQAVDQHKQQALRDYYMNRQFAQQDAADKQKQQQLAMLDKIPPPNGMDPAVWHNLPPETRLSLYTQSVTPEKPKHSPAYTEWQDAQSGGYTGSFNDYQNMDANRRRAVTNINSPGPETWAPPTKDQNGNMVQVSNRGQIRQLQGPDTGKSEIERSLYTMQHADPGSSEYAAAVSVYTQPRLINGPSGPQIATPTLPTWAKPPTYTGQPSAPAQPAINLDNSGAPAAAGFDATPVAPAPTQQQGPVTIPAPGATGTPGATGGIPVSQAAPAQPGATPAGFSISPPVQSGQSAQNKTEDARKNQQLYAEMSKQLPIALAHFDQLAKLGNQAASKLPIVGNMYVTPGFQMAKSSVNTIVADWLYSASGATANPGEVENRTNALMPQIGDSPEEIARKRDQLSSMVNDLKIRAGITPDPADDGRSVSGGNVAGGILGTPQQFQEGDTATNPTTKQRVMYKGGQWVPYQ